jgi:hypothetical protein
MEPRGRSEFAVKMEQHREECNGTRQKKIYKTLFCNAKDLINLISVNQPVIAVTPLCAGPRRAYLGRPKSDSPATTDDASRGFDE